MRSYMFFTSKQHKILIKQPENIQKGETLAKTDTKFINTKEN